MKTSLCAVVTAGSYLPAWPVNFRNVVPVCYSGCESVVGLENNEASYCLFIQHSTCWGSYGTHRTPRVASPAQNSFLYSLGFSRTCLHTMVKQGPTTSNPSGSEARHLTVEVLWKAHHHALHCFSVLDRWGFSCQDLGAAREHMSWHFGAANGTGLKNSQQGVMIAYLGGKQTRGMSWREQFYIRKISEAGDEALHTVQSGQSCGWWYDLMVKVSFSSLVPDLGPNVFEWRKATL